MPVDVAVVIPGIMGSCLEYTHASPPYPIWTECFLDNYQRLINNPAVFQYDGKTSASAPRILKFAYLKDLPLWKWFWREDLFTGLLHYLSSHQNFSHPLGVIEFPYDWRQSLTQTARKLGDFLESQGITIRKPSQFQLSIITHSMGGLVARIALVDKHIHHKNVRKIIHIAPPLMGSAKAFRSLFSGEALPFLDSFVTFCHSRKNGSLALKNLQQMMTSFTSLYQLMPPLLERYLCVGPGPMINPLDTGQSVISSALQNEAHSVHNKLYRSIGMFKRWNIQVHTVSGIGIKTDCSYKVFVKPDWYEVLDQIPCQNNITGDGTVTAISCSYNGLDNKADLRSVMGEQHAYMCNSPNVIDVLKTIV